MKILFFFILLLNTNLFFCQSYDAIKTVFKDHEFSDNIYTLIEDNEGFIWIATDNGIIKFNGSKFVKFDITSKLPSNDVFNLFADKENRIWLSGYYKGLYYIKNNEIHKIQNSQNIYGLVHFFEKKDTLFINSLIEKQTFFLRKNKKKLEKYKYFFEYIQNSNLKIIYKKEKILILENNKIIDSLINLQISNFNLVNSFSFTKEKNITYNPFFRFLPNKLNIYNKNSIRNYIIDRENPTESTLKLISRKEDDIQIFVNDKKKPIAYFKGSYSRTITNFLRKIPINFQEVNKLIIDSNSNVWVISENNELKYIPNNYENIINYNLNNIGYSKIKKVEFYNNMFYFLTVNNIVIKYDIYTKEKKDAFIGNKEIKDIQIINGNLFYFQNNEIYYSSLNNLKKRYLFNNREFRKIIFSKNDYFGIIGRGLYSKKDGLIYSKQNSLRFNNLIEFNNGFLFSNEEEIIYRDLVSKKNKNLKIKFINSIIKLNNELFIIGTNIGELLIIDKNFKIISKYKLDEGISKIKHDFKNNKLLIQTIKSIYILNIDKKFNMKYVNYIDNEDGLIKGKIIDLFYDKNKIYVISNLGYSSINNKIYNKNTVDNSKIVIDNINSINRNNLSSNFSLNREDNNLEIDFSIKTYGNIKKYVIYYKINNSKWIQSKNQKLSFVNLLPGNYKIDMKLINKSIETPIHFKNISFNVKAYFWETIYFKLFIIFLAVILTFLVGYLVIIYNRRKNSLKLKLTNLEMKSLKAQMNPHYLFNSLNSFQTFLFLKDEIKVNNYLIKFSNLLRATLDNVNNDFITINEETNYIKKFIDFENLKRNINIKLIIKNNLSNDNIVIPSMLLQPIIENSIIHGFKIKRDDYYIELNFYDNKDKYLFIEVTDNGIGISNKLEKENYKSYGVSIIKERLKIMSLIDSLDYNFLIENVLSEDSKVLGTKVTLKLPLINN